MSLCTEGIRSSPPFLAHDTPLLHWPCLVAIRRLRRGMAVVFWCAYALDFTLALLRCLQPRLLLPYSASLPYSTRQLKSRPYGNLEGYPGSTRQVHSPCLGDLQDFAFFVLNRQVHVLAPTGIIVLNICDNETKGVKICNNA